MFFAKFLLKFSLASHFGKGHTNRMEKDTILIRRAAIELLSKKEGGRRGWRIKCQMTFSCVTFWHFPCFGKALENSVSVGVLRFLDSLTEIVLHKSKDYEHKQNKKKEK